MLTTCRHSLTLRPASLYLPRYLSGTSRGLRESDLSEEYTETPLDFQTNRELREMWQGDVDARRRLYEEKSRVMAARLGAFQILPRKDDATETIVLQAVVCGNNTTSLSITPGHLSVDSLDEAMVLADNISQSSPVDLLEMVAYRLWLWRNVLLNSQLKAERSMDRDPLREAREKMFRDFNEWFTFMQRVSHLSVH